MVLNNSLQQAGLKVSCFNSPARPFAYFGECFKYCPYYTRVTYVRSDDTRYELAVAWIGTTCRDLGFNFKPAWY